jgi:hypothetical protein
MAEVQVRVLQPDRIYSSTHSRLLTVGTVLPIDEEIAGVWVEAELAEYVEESTSTELNEKALLTIEEFGELKAEHQKEYLTNLQIEGDMGNEEKRTELYEEYLQKKGE